MRSMETAQQKDITQHEPGPLEFRRSAIHGLGGFVTREISSGARIIEYQGIKIDKQESQKRCEQNNHFIFSLNAVEDLDGDVAWNPARLLNHSCSPNCDAELDNDRIWIVARRAICTGEEITFNYGYDLVDYEEYPCHCGSSDCVGFIVAEEFFDRVRRNG